MGSVAEVAALAGVQPQKHGGLALFDAGAARVFLDACARAGTRVLGVEGFDVDGDGVRPDMDAIADLSVITEPAVSVTEAKAFLDDLGPTGLLFEFVLEGTPGR